MIEWIIFPLGFAFVVWLIFKARKEAEEKVERR